MGGGILILKVRPVQRLRLSSTQRPRKDGPPTGPDPHEPTQGPFCLWEGREGPSDVGV